MKFILALDQGTTSSRAILFDEEGSIKAVAQKEFTQHFPRPGWVEHDPNEIWETQLWAMREVVRVAKIDPKEIGAIGITNQRETTLLWDRKTGQPVHRAIVWQDRRTADRCEELRLQGKESLLREKTGLLADAYFSATKLEWMLRNVEGAAVRAAKGELAFGTIDSWIIWNLTGGSVHLTDVTNASRTLLLNIATGQWDAELLALFNIPESLLPRVVPSSEVYGETRLLGPSIPIAGIGGDQQAALFGQRCVRPGMAKNTYGTGCFMLLNTGRELVRSKNNLLTTIASQLDGQLEYALEGSVFVAGAAIQWLRDGLGIISSSSEVEQIALSVPDSGGVCLVPAFTGLGAPHWDPYARGTLIGLTRGTTRAHIVRAAVESIALQSYDLLEAMQKDSGIAVQEMRVDGGAAVNDFLMQLQADLLGVPVIRPSITETTALGAAYLAGMAVGLWNSETLDSKWKMERTFHPKMPAAEKERMLSLWAEAVNRSKGWAR